MYIFIGRVVVTENRRYVEHFKGPSVKTYLFTHILIVLIDCNLQLNLIIKRPSEKVVASSYMEYIICITLNF